MTERRPLVWWRNRKAVSQLDLANRSGVSRSNIQKIEKDQHAQVLPSTKRKLAAALDVEPGTIVFPGDPQDRNNGPSVEDLLRAELRGARKALRRAHDFLRDDSNITFRAQDARDALLRDVEREVRGL